MKEANENLLPPPTDAIEPVLPRGEEMEPFCLGDDATGLARPMPAESADDTARDTLRFAIGFDASPQMLTCDYIAPVGKT